MKLLLLSLIIFLLLPSSFSFFFYFFLFSFAFSSSFSCFLLLFSFCYFSFSPPPPPSLSPSSSLSLFFAAGLLLFLNEHVISLSSDFSLNVSINIKVICCHNIFKCCLMNWYLNILAVVFFCFLFIQPLAESLALYKHYWTVHSFY